MSHKFLLNSSFHKFLKSIDHDISEEERAKGCPHCGGSLHQANYPRSPFGVPMEHREHYAERYSHCCAQCRKRTTSGSVRFFGRHWFPSPLLTLISALMHNSINKCREQLKRLFGVIISNRTCKRWKRWWKDSFVKTKFWKGVSGIVPIAHLRGPFPRQLFSMFSALKDPVSHPLGSAVSLLAKRLISVVQFLAPLAAGSLRAV